MWKLLPKIVYLSFHVFHVSKFLGSSFSNAFSLMRTLLQMPKCLTPEEFTAERSFLSSESGTKKKSSRNCIRTTVWCSSKIASQITKKLASLKKRQV